MPTLIPKIVGFALLFTTCGNALGEVLFFDNFEQFGNGTDLTSTNYTPASGPSSASVATSVQNGSPTPAQAQINGCDDFSDNFKDPTRWGPVFTQGCCGLLTETNGRLEFTKSSGTSSALASQPWILNFGSYTQNWEVQIDVSVPLLGFPEAVFGLGVISGTNVTSGNHFQMSLFESSSEGRFFLMRFGTNGGSFDRAGQVATTSTFAGLRIVFDASTKVLSAFYDEDGPVDGYSWTLLGSTNISTAWNMTSTDVFEVSVFGRAEADVVTSTNNLFGDNFCVSSGPTPAPSFQWAKRVASTTNQDDELSIGLAIDSAANVYVTGWFDGTNDFGGVTLTNKSGGGQDVFVAKYNSSGVLQWARRAGSDAPPGTGTHDEGRDAGRGIGVDGAGNVYVTGGFFGNADFDSFAVTALTNREFFLAKYDRFGVVQWVRQSVGGNGYGPGWNDGVYGTGLAVDGAGNCYAVGFAANVTAFGTPIMFETTSLDNTNTDGGSTFLVKYDNTGAVQWAKSLNSPDESYGTKVAVGALGNVYLKGGFRESMRIGTTNLVSVDREDMFIAKFDSSGALIWVRQEVGGGGEGGVAVDQDGNVFVTGAFSSNPTYLGGIGLTNAGSWDAFVAKYDNSGAIQWARRAGGTNLDFYWDASSDQQGNIHVVGVLSPDSVAPSGSGAMVAKYDPSGTLQWATSASGPPAGPVASVVAKCAVDSGGNCYLAGWYQTTTTFGTAVLPPQGYWNYFIAKVGFTPLTLGIVWSNALPKLSVFGEIGNRVALEYVSALTASNKWQSLITNMITSNPFIHTDTNAVGSARRFYRARSVP